MYDLQVKRNSAGRQHAAQTLSEILYCCTEKKKKGKKNQTKDAVNIIMSPREVRLWGM